ncbi:MAG TPA: ImmA/IrrE family metallo-endopeptidase [Mycobacteriales bacterium]|nr:ImmA/IrrE family metallo-endopeptidase [Mycobacteriales bacterium]
MHSLFTFTHTIRDLRQLMPPYRPVDYQAKSILERQAAKLLEIFDIREAPVDVALIAELPRLEVVVRPSREVVDDHGRQLSGLTKWDKGRWLIKINRDDSPTRRRFTLAHEFGHVLEHPFVRVLYADTYGRLDEQRMEDHCDYFAACLLMPRPWVKQAWANLTQDQARLAAYFRVSPAAMARRLAYLNLTEPHPARHLPQPIRRYFRHAPASVPLSTELVA